jgi:sodium transport system ATP-binding protein
VIEASDLHKRFGRVDALAGASFVARDGRITGLLGPNGAGKSTTLRILATVLRADSGHATIDGCSVAADPLGVRRRIGVLPHNSALYGNLTARENIAYFAAAQGLDGAARRDAVARAIERLGIGALAERRARGFSQGERLRTALARALVHDPQTIILDEPTNGLDVMSTRSLREIIAGLRAQGRCVLFSSHVMQEVAALCDEIVIIAGGRVAIAGTPDAIRERTGRADLEDAFVHAVQTHGAIP